MNRLNQMVGAATLLAKTIFGIFIVHADSPSAPLDDTNVMLTSDSMRRQGIYVLVIGLSIGWLAGLSASPVVSGLLTSIVGIVGGIVVGFSGIGPGDREESSGKRRRVDALPSALLVLGIAVAAPVGIFTRTHDILGSQSIQREGSSTNSQRLDSRLLSEIGALFSDKATECAELLSVAREDDEQALMVHLRNSNLQWAKELAARKPEIGVVKTLVGIICQGD